MRIFYLGPKGTFTNDAARTYFPDATDEELFPEKSPLAVMHQVAAHRNAVGVVPIENSIHGEVLSTLDALCFEFDQMYVVGEVALPINFNWYAVSAEAAPHTVLSHEHALAQCKQFISTHELTQQKESSTAEACRIVAERRDPNISAIASTTAGEHFSLQVLASNVEDFDHAMTRFLVLRKHLAPARNQNRTMLALLAPTNRPGTLAEFSSQFASRGINIYGIFNRPMRTGAGYYLFVLTIEGSAFTPPTSEALKALLQLGYGVKLIGCYAACRGETPASPWPQVPGLLTIEGLTTLSSQGE